MTRMRNGFCVLIVALSQGWVGAEMLNIANPGFEDIVGEPQFNEFSFTPPPDWDLYDPDGMTNGGNGPTYFLGTLTPFEPDPLGMPGVYTNFPAGAPEGQRVAIAFNFEGSGGQGEYGIEQRLTDRFQPHTIYTLQVEIGDIASGTAMSGEFFPLDGFSGYRAELTADGATIAEDNNTLASVLTDGQFATSTIEFVTGASPPDAEIGIRLVNLNDVDPDFPFSDLEVDFDHVRLDATPVPEPGVMPIALAMLALRRRVGPSHTAVPRPAG